MSLAQWLREAQAQPTVFLAQVQPHPAGSVVALVSFLAGLASAQWVFPGHQVLSWVALVGLLVGMVLHWRWKTADTGWRVDFPQRRVEPVGLRGQAEQVEGEGWSVQVGPGDRRSHLAIDLRHRDRGRVARLLDTPARGSRPLRQVDELADLLARRLQVPRTGPRLGGGE